MFLSSYCVAAEKLFFRDSINPINNLLYTHAFTHTEANNWSVSAGYVNVTRAWMHCTHYPMLGVYVLCDIHLYVDAIHIYESEWNQTVTLTLTFHSRVTLQTTNLGMLVRLVASIIHTNIVVGLSVS